MPTPNSSATPGAMSGAEFTAWLARVRELGIATSEAGAGELIGRSEDTVRRMKARGADRTTALACAAILMRQAIRNALPADVTKHGGLYVSFIGKEVHRIEMSPEAYRALVGALTN